MTSSLTNVRNASSYSPTHSPTPAHEIRLQDTYITPLHVSCYEPAEPLKNKGMSHTLTQIQLDDDEYVVGNKVSVVYYNSSNAICAHKNPHYKLPYIPDPSFRAPIVIDRAHTHNEEMRVPTLHSAARAHTQRGK